MHFSQEIIKVREWVLHTDLISVVISLIFRHCSQFFSGYYSRVAWMFSWRVCLRPIYTVRLCRIPQGYDRPTTWIISCKSNLQLAYDCRVGPNWCRRPVVSLLYATKSCRVNRPLCRLVSDFVSKKKKTSNVVGMSLIFWLQAMEFQLSVIHFETLIGV